MAEHTIRYEVIEEWWKRHDGKLHNL